MLDASVRVEILELLARLQRAHDLGVIYITHDLSSVRHFSDRIFVMYAGQIIEKAEVHELIHDALHPYTRALLAAIPDPDSENVSRFKTIPPGEPPSLVQPPAGCRFHPRCAEFMAGLCDRQEPPEFARRAKHFAMCWLYREKQ
jgi:peptide/nickel transport system ATP-binding protein